MGAGTEGSMSLGDRMKRYENRNRLQIKTPVIIRVDGKCFHTFTKRLHPFDQRLAKSMLYAGQNTAKEMSGFVMGYHQSDECSFYLTDTMRDETQAWFDYKQDKITSVTASLFTGFFNDIYGRGGFPPAAFDARAFNMPSLEVPNYFLWRHRDWERNAKSILAHIYMSTKELHGKSTKWITEKFLDKWLTLRDDSRFGTFFSHDETKISKLMRSYREMHEYISYARETKNGK
jgi:tRNA(His) 5'-end guanylyltransferase